MAVCRSACRLPTRNLIGLEVDATRQSVVGGLASVPTRW
jgi:hypothetical protein